jgi:hypothetical protein
MAGVDLLTVKELMGRKTIEMTMRYAHLAPGHRTDAVRRLDSASGDTNSDTNSDTGTESAAVPIMLPPQVINFSGEGWCARQDSNLRPTGSKPGALSS